MSIRLNKLIAWRGVAARRKADRLIAEGRVRVNGQVVREPGTMVDEQSDRVEVMNRPLPPPQRAKWFMLHKPVGVISTVSDPEGRRTVRSLLPTGSRVFPVGRLDADTSGLLLLTNDGPLAHKLMHPRYGVEKVYRVRLSMAPRPDQLRRLAQGVRFDEGAVSAPAQVRAIDPGFAAIMIEIRIHEGRFRQVRRMCEAVGLEVLGLHRVAYGPLRLGPLPRGEFRELAHEEVELLRQVSARPVRRPGSARPARGGRAADEAKRRALYMHGTDAEPASEAPAVRSPRPAGRGAGGRPERRRSTPWIAVEESVSKRGRNPARPARGMPEDEPDMIEESWGPGAGGLGDDLHDAEWPARPSARRGDADFTGPQRSRASRPAKSRTGEPRRATSSLAPRGPAPAARPRREASSKAARPARRRPETGPPGRRNPAAAPARRADADPRERRAGAGSRRASASEPRGRRGGGPSREVRQGAAPRGFTQRGDRRGPATPQRARNARRRDTAGPSGTARRKRGGGVISPRRRKG